MGIWSHIVTHMNLISEMFARTGAVNRFAEEGNENSLRQAIMRCQACGAARECGEFLETAEQGCEPPSFCNNARLINRLRQVEGVS